ncbi:hypothetical protein [Streptomyces sp. 3N207]
MDRVRELPRLGSGPHTLQPATERALHVLLADSADPDLFGSLTGV